MTPALVNSSRMGITINSGYIVLPPETDLSGTASRLIVRCGVRSQQSGVE
jgi:hypothetical protein